MVHHAAVQGMLGLRLALLVNAGVCDCGVRKCWSVRLQC